MYLIYCINCEWEDEFDHHSYLDGNQDNFRLYWTTLNETHIEIGLEVNSTGWIALGVSENKQMINSDIMMGWVDINSDNTIYLQNRYTESVRTTPQIMFDNNGNEDNTNFELVSGEQIDGVTRIRYIRLINGCNKYSKLIPMGTTRIIWAFNNYLPIDNELPQYHGEFNRGSQSINLLLGESMEIALGQNVSTFDITISNFSLPNDKDTHYVCTLLKLPELNIMHHIVKFEPIITDGNEATVHHIDLYHCPSEYVDPDSPAIGFQAICDDWPNMPVVSNVTNCRTSQIIAWSIGAKSFYLPPNVGMELSGNGDDALQYATMEIHYDNPKLIANITDSSGLRIYYTPHLRNESAAILNIAKAMSHLVVPPGIPYALFKGYCYSSCLYNQLDDTQYFKAFANSFHSHLLGRTMKLRHIRNGKELKPIDINTAYDFNYQQMVPLVNTVDIYGGDTLIIECGYDSSNRSFTTFGGLSSRDEMCIAFLMYYPKHNITHCASRFLEFDWNNFFEESIQRGFYNETTKFYNISADDGDDGDALQFYESFIYETEYRQTSCARDRLDLEPEVEPVVDGFDVYQDDNNSNCVQEQSTDNIIWYIVYGAIGLCVVVVFTVVVMCYYRKQKQRPSYVKIP